MDVGHIDHAASGPVAGPLADRFEGAARMQHFTSPFDDALAAFAVHIGDGARTRPHVHRSGQILHICDREGVVANEAGARPGGRGDVVSVAADEWHWHGAARGASMTHLTIQHDRDAETLWEVGEGNWAGDGAGRKAGDPSGPARDR